MTMKYLHYLRTRIAFAEAIATVVVRKETTEEKDLSDISI
jgi:hypothetical protein